MITTAELIEDPNTGKDPIKVQILQDRENERKTTGNKRVEKPQNNLLQVKDSVVSQYEGGKGSTVENG